MNSTQIATNEPSRAMIREFIRRWGVQGGVQRAAAKLGTTVQEVNRARRFF
jgi:hypothetical protein